MLKGTEMIRVTVVIMTLDTTIKLKRFDKKNQMFLYSKNSVENFFSS